MTVVHDQVLTGIDLTQYVNDADGDALTISVGIPSIGQLTPNADGNYDYTPPTGWGRPR